jgi:hypothetical protein
MWWGLLSARTLNFFLSFRFGDPPSGSEEHPNFQVSKRNISAAAKYQLIFTPKFFLFHKHLHKWRGLPLQAATDNCKQSHWKSDDIGRIMNFTKIYFSAIRLGQNFTYPALHPLSLCTKCKFFKFSNPRWAEVL